VSYQGLEILEGLLCTKRKYSGEAKLVRNFNFSQDLKFKTTTLKYRVLKASVSWLQLFQAAWGGGLLLSRKYRHPKLSGIER
jgi:hypothetical protein